MEKKRIRLVLFSAWGSDYRQIELSLTIFALLLGGAVMLLSLLMTGLLLGSRMVFQEYYARVQEDKQQVLRTQFEQWQDRTLELARRYERAEGLPGEWNLTLLEPATQPDSGASLTGRGGPFVEEEDKNPLSVQDRLPETRLFSEAWQQDRIDNYHDLSPSDLLNHLESRLATSRQATQVIFEDFEQLRRQLEHIPSIKPVLSGRVTDSFGKRVDPFVRKLRHHSGLDVAAPYGTKVFAPAAGVVELAKSTYRPNRGYGRVVIVDHGQGLKTLYGHLSKVLVRKGQQIRRWDVIGLVGDTGRATGPHLHYEVWADGSAQNPVEYIINE